MKKIVMTLLFILFVLYGIPKAQGFSYDEDDETIWGYLNAEINYSANKQSNYKLCLNYDKSYFETELLSVSTITTTDHRTRISSNALFTECAFASLWFMAEGEGKILFIPICIGSLAPLVLGNAKVYLPVSKKHLWVGGGLNTDYYLFYKNSSVMYTEILYGVKIGFKKIKIYANYRVPFNGSYLEKNEPYLNIGLVLESTILRNRKRKS